MLTRTLFAEAWRCPFVSPPPSPPPLVPAYSGKVRELYTLDPWLVMVTTDRISAFDRVLGGIPFRGQILNQLTAFWAQALQDVTPTAVVAVPDPNVMVARQLQPIRVEVVVRGYITGVTDTSLWTRYARGEREIYGYPLPSGLNKDDPLPEPLITPTTKSLVGHDEQLTRDEVVTQGLLEAQAWTKVQTLAHRIFARGTEIAAAAGLILVDTKYEFGFGPQGEIVLMDEFHTPDSSRYWKQDDPTRGNWDKEFLRQWLVTQGYTGRNAVPVLSEEAAFQMVCRYAEVLERLTGRPFAPGPYPAAARVHRCLQSLTAAQFSLV